MGKILHTNDLENEIKKIKDSGQTIVLAGGCFDIIHEGHTTFLSHAKKLGDTLIIFLESDETVKKLKGENRPINTQEIRARNLNQLEVVDYIIPLQPLITDSDYLNIVKQIKPDIIAITKGDPIERKKRTHAQQIGSQVVEVINRLPQYSTTDIINTLFEKR